MELRLQRFIKSMQTISDVRNLDPFNPIQILMEHPVTATLYTIIISIPEPSYMGIPINTIWIAMDSTKPFYSKALKLKAVDAESYTGEAELIENLKQAWIEISTHDEIFSDPQFYDNGSGGGVPGPKGDKGDKGDTGEQGPRGFPGESPVLDYAAIAVEVAKILGGTSVEKSLTITGVDTLVEGSNSQFAVNLVAGEDITPIIATITASAGGSFVNINSSNLITALAVNADQTVTLTASYVSGGETLTATKTITIVAAGLNSISMTGLATTIFEGRTAQLAVTAAYSNGTNAAVTSSATYEVNPSSAGTVSASGLFTAASVSADTPFSITATFIEGSTTRTVTTNSTVRNIIVSSLAITGSATVNEKTTTNYTATVTRNDGTTATVTPTWSISDPAAGTIASSGAFTAADVSANVSATISATYTFEGVTVNATRAITVANVAAVIYPYIGVASSTATMDAAFILSLPDRGPNASRLMNPWMPNAAAGQSYYYAYPVSYGLADFFDIDSGFSGGMDGAQGNPESLFGPITVNVTIDGVSVPFYLYKSDKSGLGLSKWDVR